VRDAVDPWLSRRRYYNFAERDVDPVSFYAHGDYGRLTAIRERVDPDALFQAKHTIV
jgi:berberine-like enzyme